MDKRRRIAVITGSRAEYGLLYWIIKAIHDDRELKLELIVTGMHLSSEFGLTVKEIEKDSFPIAEKVHMLLSSDSEEAIATSMGLGMIGFAKAYSKLKPDIIVVLGDRFEIFAAVGAAIPYRIPVAHIHGGEATEGIIDELIRHAITKMSHIHFAAAPYYRRRIIQMGEDPRNVFCFGAPGIDNIVRLDLLERKKLYEALNVPGDRRIGVVTYHPVTLEDDSQDRQISNLLAALEERRDLYWIFTLTNADTKGRTIITKMEEFVRAHHNDAALEASFGQRLYLSLLKYASVMVGNSSSGLIEAPTFKLPVVNIGDRQRGRVRAKNVIDVKRCSKKLIRKAIDKALSRRFRESLQKLKNPYRMAGASERIVEKLKTLSLDERLIKKRFCEIRR